MEQEFKEIKLKDWSRREEFLYFTKIMPSIYTLTVECDVTELLVYRKKTGISYFALCLWLVSKAVNEIPEFRLGYRDNGLVQYNKIVPMFPVFHEEAKKCTMMCVDTEQSFYDFYEEFQNQLDIARKEQKFFTSKYSAAPINTFNISMEPRIHFSGFSLMYPIQTAPPKLSPIIELGKYEEHNGRMIMPVALQEHHAAANGYQAGAFYDKIKLYFSEPQTYIK